MSTTYTTAAIPTADQMRDEAHDLLRQAHPRMGEYAHDIIDGLRALSGADLQGAAKVYGGSYKRARLAAVEAIEAAGGHVRRSTDSRHRLTVEWGDIPADADLDGCSVGDCWVY